jgi:protein Tex
MAREKGLEPLAKIIMQQQETLIEKRAEEFINDQLETVEDALQGARDIIAEWISENQDARNTVRRFFSRGAAIYSKLIKGKEVEGIKFSDYYEFSEPLNRCPSHQYTWPCDVVNRKGIYGSP